MKCIYYIGLHDKTLHVLQEALQETSLKAIAEPDIVGNVMQLPSCDALLIGEQVANPVRVAQEAFSKDKAVSILLINERANHQKVRQSLQFAPFVGPTIQALSNELGGGLVTIVEDAIQRTEQRRNYVRMRSAGPSIPAFNPNYMEKVRVNFMTRVLDEAPIGAALLAKDGAVLNVNNYIQRLLGRSDKDILGSSFASHFPEKERIALQDFIADGYLSKPKRTFELGEGDNCKFLEISIGDIDTASTSPYKIAIVNDVTEATLARQRTLAHVAELQKLNEELRRVNEDLDTFVYTASHDLKSPILNIEGLVNLLEESLSQEQSVPELEHIRLSVERFKNTIEDLTEVARIQRNFGQDAVEINVEELIADVQQLLQSEIEQSGAVIEVDVQHAPSVLFSKKNFKSVLLNLLSNAIKYRSQERQPHIFISTAIQNGHFQLRIQDNGLGIPAGKQDRVFQLFKRMHAHVQGSGIGLYIVKRIVSNSGGSVQVDSREGEGTSFIVNLPLRSKSS